MTRVSISWSPVPVRARDPDKLLQALYCHPQTAQATVCHIVLRAVFRCLHCASWCASLGVPDVVESCCCKPGCSSRSASSRAGCCRRSLVFYRGRTRRHISPDDGIMAVCRYTYPVAWGHSEFIYLSLGPIPTCERKYSSRVPIQKYSIVSRFQMMEVKPGIQRNRAAKGFSGKEYHSILLAIPRGRQQAFVQIPGPSNVVPLLVCCG